MQFQWKDYVFISAFKAFIDELNQNNSRNYKMEILKKWSDHKAVLYFLDFLYNPYIITGISDKKLNKDVEYIPYSSTPGTLWLEDEQDTVIFEYVKNHNTGRDVDIWTVQQYRRRHISEELWDLFNKVITKNLPLGIDVLTINKCIPNLIPTFNVMLANKHFEKPDYVNGKLIALTTKIDGARIIALKENGQVSFYTRAGQPYEGLVDLEQEMQEKLPDNICLDGEITLLNPYVVETDEEGRPAIGRRLSSKEQYKETMKITRKDGEKHDIKMLVFDCMTAEEFRNQKCDTPYLCRRNNLFHKFCEKLEDCDISTTVAVGCEPTNYYNSLINLLNSKHTYFQILPYLYIGDDTSKITEWLNYNIQHGEEGVMINICDAPYEFKRTWNLLKVKKMNDIDLPILDFEEGTNKHAGKLGAIITEYKGFPLKVGSGFTDELRENIWNNKEEYRGLTMSVQYFEETTNQEGGISLRFPVFLDFRYDK